MPLIALWTASPEAVGEFTIEQVVATAGDGILKDGSVCSQELRQYIAQIPASKIALYIEQCLSTSFNKGGMVLQDLINELGRRLDYDVTNGRYQGTVNAVGYDGIWVSPEGHAIIAEVKTTDAYRISLDTIASYRDKLLKAGEIPASSSILIIVGREDTGELEAQVRGSRHAWDIRLISADALIKLVQLKENADGPETGRKIRSLLAPMEYTRLDRMVDVMFTTATDVEAAIVSSGVTQEDSFPSVEGKSESKGAWEFTDSALLQAKREEIVAAVSRSIGRTLIKKSRALFWSPEHDKRIACTISKRYTKRSSYPYWYAYHPQWDEFLSEADSYLILGCMDLSIAFSIPWRVFHPLLESLNTTTTEKGTYWHVHLSEVSPGRYGILLPKQGGTFALDEYKVSLQSSSS